MYYVVLLYAAFLRNKAHVYKNIRAGEVAYLDARLVMEKIHTLPVAAIQCYLVPVL